MGCRVGRCSQAHSFSRHSIRLRPEVTHLANFIPSAPYHSQSIRPTQSHTQRCNISVPFKNTEEKSNTISSPFSPPHRIPSAQIQQPKDTPSQHLPSIFPLSSPNRQQANPQHHHCIPIKPHANKYHLSSITSPYQNPSPQRSKLAPSSLHNSRRLQTSRFYPILQAALLRLNHQPRRSS